MVFTFPGEVEFEGKAYAFALAINADGYLDPGRTSGPPEMRYPPESEFEVLGSVWAVAPLDDYGNPPPDLEAFHAFVLEHFEDDIEEAFFQELKNEHE